ncbi:MAG: hypothetical protein ABSA13_17450 [Beijerinckiaceae bacterium]|jgi:hypothetical protein
MREVCSISLLQGICLRSLKTCPGFDLVNEIVIQPRESLDGGANWTLAAIRPRVGNQVLREARDTIHMLQTTYELMPEDVAAKANRRHA